VGLGEPGRARGPRHSESKDPPLHRQRSLSGRLLLWVTIANSLSTMDVQATLQLSTNPEVGLLLPCNITVRRSEGRCIVQALDPGALLGVAAGTHVS
jgi:hypothetical protein